MYQRSALFCVLLGLVFTFGCAGGGGGGGGAPQLSGEVQFVSSTSAAFGVANTPAIGATRVSAALDPSALQLLHGVLVDGRDLLRLQSSERLAVEARLVDAPEARFACVDPLSLALGTVGTSARFLARGPVDLLVRGPDGAYTLELKTRPISGPVPLAGYLGSFLVGDALQLAAQAPGRARLSCAETLDLLVRAGGELTVFGADGREFARLGSAGGELRLAGAMLTSFEIAVEAAQARPIELVAVEAQVLRPCARLAALEEERERFGLSPQDELATVCTHEFVPAQLLVRARAGQALEPALSRRSSRIDQSIPETSELVSFDLPPGLEPQEAARTTLAAIAAFEVAPQVEWAEPNRVRRALGGGTLTPNDTFYHLQWHYELIRLPEAWVIETGSADVVVAVLDTGQRLHPDLDANTVVGFDFISSAANAGDLNGIDADPTDVGDGTAATPSSFHGTHVAGTIGALGDNNFGVTGVNWACSLMHLRVLGKLGGTDADIAQAVRYAAGLSNSSGLLPAEPARVINMSLGGPGSTNTMQSAVSAARNAGVVLFAAAGNENSSSASFPAAYDGVVSVMAVDPNAQKAPYSNFGATIDLAAPGGSMAFDLTGDGFADGVLSTQVDENNGFSPQFVFEQGTSMACPHAAGLAALVFAVDPLLSPAQVESILQSTAFDLGATGKDSIFGHGLIQADLALTAASGIASATPVLSVSPSSLNFGSAKTELTLQVANVGGGALDVGTAVFTPAVFGENFASFVVNASSGASDVSSIVMTVDRDGLLDGEYAGVLSVPSSGGDIDVPVTMSVAAPSSPEDVDLFLLLIDADSYQTVAEVVLNPTLDLAWEIATDFEGAPLPTGNYLLLCGSDDDADLFIFGENDIYRGAWPTLNELEELVLAKGDQLSGLDFVVAPAQSTMTSLALPAQGFHRLSGKP